MEATSCGKEAFHRHLAAEIVAQLPNEQGDLRQVLSLVLMMADIPTLEAFKRPDHDHRRREGPAHPPGASSAS